MKLIFSTFILLFVASISQAQLTDGMSASSNLGQSDWNGNSVFTRNGRGDSPNPFGISFPKGIALDEVGHRLFVSDSNNNRVLVFLLHSDNSLLDYRADFVLGQTNFFTNASGTSQTEFSQPLGLEYDHNSDLLFVADSGNNRILIFDVAIISNGEPAVHVLGQPDFTSNASATTASAMSAPASSLFDASHNFLYVADYSNSRVLVFDLNAISDGENAVHVLGQPDFVSSSNSINISSFYSPTGLILDTSTNQLFVADHGNNRVMIFDVSSITDGEDAIHVLGQPDFTSNSSVTTRSGQHFPVGLALDTSTHILFVSEEGNNRIVTYDVTVIVDGEDAVSVLGQQDFVTSTIGISASTVRIPSRMAIDATNHKLFALDGANNRVLTFDVATISNGEDAIDVLGQNEVISSTPVFTKSGEDNSPSSIGLNRPFGMAFDEPRHKIFLTDSNFNRVLVFNLTSDNILIDRAADSVIGQPDLNTRTDTLTQNGLNGPTDVAYDPDHERLFVADSGNNRILVYDLSTVTPGENATHVLGQIDFTSNVQGATASTFSLLSSIAYDRFRQRLFAGDQSGNRVLVFDVSSITDGESAVAVLGQPDFTSTTGSITADSISGGVYGVAYNSTRNWLAVTDTSIHRVLIFDVSTISNGEDAIHVVGQPDFTTTSLNPGPNNTAAPYGVDFDEVEDRLVIAEPLIHRVQIHNLANLTNGQAASHVLGHIDFSTFSSGLSQSTFNSPARAKFSPSGDTLYVSDSVNNRVMIFDIAASHITGVTTSPPSGSYFTGEAIDISITFSLPVTVTGAPTLTLATGSTQRSATYVSGSGSTTLVFRYIVQAGDSASDLDYVGTDSLSLAGGTIRDSGSNAADLTLPSPGASGSLGANASISINPGVTASVSALLDIDADGITDVVEYRRTSKSIAFHGIQSSDNTDKSASFNVRHGYPVAGDFDGDGKWDYGFISQSSKNRVSWSVFNQESGLTTQELFGTTDSIIFSGCNFDLEGKSPLAYIRNGILKYKILNDSSSTRTVRLSRLARGARFRGCADVNDDGVDDLLFQWGKGASQLTQAFTIQGQRVFSRKLRESRYGFSADTDGDQTKELVLAGEGKRQKTLSLYKLPDLSFIERQKLPQPGRFTNGICEAEKSCLIRKQNAQTSERSIFSPPQTVTGPALQNGFSLLPPVNFWTLQP